MLSLQFQQNCRGINVKLGAIDQCNICANTLIMFIFHCVVAEQWESDVRITAYGIFYLVYK